MQLFFWKKVLVYLGITHMGLVVTRYDTACRRRISYSHAVRAGDYFIVKLKFLLYGHVMYILLG